MIEVYCSSKGMLMPIGSIIQNAFAGTDWIVYDHFEDDEKEVYVEICTQVKPYIWPKIISEIRQSDG